jgi:hypothetical protein
MASSRPHRGTNRPSRRPAPVLEPLEARVVPYAVTGNAWPSPQLVTISFMPDGTTISTNGTQLVGSNLFSKFNAKFGSASAWENIILKAAQNWAVQTNINFAVVADDGVAIGSGPYQQGDPNHGDIRVGGYSFGSSILATAYMPPPANNYDAAGEIKFNTGMTFNNGSTYDLFTVAAHEFGHALGLDHSTATTAVMYSAYNGVKQGPSSDDIAGVRSIYSSGAARAADAFDAAASNNSVATATDLTSRLDPVTLSEVVTGDITTTSDTDYYTVTAPVLTSSTLTVGVQSSGLSLLSPKVTVYAADGSTVLGSAGTSGQYGATLSVTVNNVTAGTQYYVKVAGADSTVFGTGAYALTLNFGTGASPAVPPPSTTLLNGNPTQGGGGLAEVPGEGDQHADNFSAAAAGAVVSAQRTPAAATPDAGTVSVLFVQVQSRSAGQPAAAPPAAVERAVSTDASARADFGRSGTPSGPDRLSGVASSETQATDGSDGASLRPRTEQAAPARPGETNPARDAAPARPEAREALPTGAGAAAVPDDFQAADAVFTSAEHLARQPADPAGDAVQEGGAGLVLFGETALMAVLQGRYQAAADDAGDPSNEEKRRKPHMIPRS